MLAEDKLFATLDPTTRRLKLPTNQNVLLTDTVGFIKKLPHGLVEAFKATLEEVVQADLLLHVVDISHPQAEEQIDAVNAVLMEIGAAEKPVLMVFNKIDRLAPADRVDAVDRLRKISARRFHFREDGRRRSRRCWRNSARSSGPSASFWICACRRKRPPSLRGFTPSARW